MKRWSLLFAATLLFAALPDAAHAQSRSNGGWWEWAAQSDRDRPTGSVRAESDRPRTTRSDRERGSRRDRDDRRNDRERRAEGPKFCRNGQGHPTKGMRWCYEKGFATPRYDRRSDRRQEPQWERRTIEDIIFGTPRRDRDRRTTMTGPALSEVLGARAVRELGSAAGGPIMGRWLYPSRTTRVLQLRDRRGPLVEMTDYDGDNRVDLVLVNSLR